MISETPSFAPITPQWCTKFTFRGIQKTCLYTRPLTLEGPCKNRTSGVKEVKSMEKITALNNKQVYLGIYVKFDWWDKRYFFQSWNLKMMVLNARTSLGLVSVQKKHSKQFHRSPTQGGFLNQRSTLKSGDMATQNETPKWRTNNWAILLPSNSHHQDC